ncbi:unnamed protein product [Urochloa humidicola]
MLLRASVAAVTLRAATWSELAHRLLRRCAAAGSPHSCYLLGMVAASKKMFTSEVKRSKLKGLRSSLQ